MTQLFKGWFLFICIYLSEDLILLGSFWPDEGGIWHIGIYFYAFGLWVFSHLASFNSPQSDIMTRCQLQISGNMVLVPDVIRHRTCLLLSSMQLMNMCALKRNCQEYLTWTRCCTQNGIHLAQTTLIQKECQLVKSFVDFDWGIYISSWCPNIHLGMSNQLNSQCPSSGQHTSR